MNNSRENSNDQPPGGPWHLANDKSTKALSDLIASFVQEIPADRVLQIETDRSTGVYFLLSGWLAISKSNFNGDRQIVDFLLPGNVFDPASATEIMASTDVSALTNTRIAIIPRDDWLQYLSDHREAHDMALRLAAAGFARIAERLLRIGKGSGETRLAYAICELGLRVNASGLLAGKKFHLPLTQQVLGDFVGLSSVHVSRITSRLVRQGLLSYGDHMDLVIHDIDALAEIGEIDPHDLRAEIVTTARSGQSVLDAPRRTPRGPSH